MKRTAAFLFLFFTMVSAWAQPERLQQVLDSLCKAGEFPGLSVAIIDKNGKEMSRVSGYNDKEKQTMLTVKDRMLQGSVGKTYAAAVALRLVKSGQLNLEEKVAHYLGTYSWFDRLPNAKHITVRMLMNHTSGIMRYEFKPAFTTDLTAQPDKHWQPEELLQYVLDEQPAFAAGEGWDYSDTNYILLGMIIEKLTGKKFYEVLEQTILKPYQLTATFPSDKRVLPGLAQGYAGEGNDFGKKDKVLDEQGRFVINPQFEWTGGGLYSTTTDLARWGKLLYEGKVVDTALLLHDAAPAKLGKDSRYGLGVIIRQTEIGTSYGHSGFFPGYLTELAYFPAQKLCIALQTNSSDFKKNKIPLQRCLLVLAKAVREKAN